MIVMRKWEMAVLLIVTALVFLAGCGNVVDGPGMVNTEYEQGY